MQLIFICVLSLIGTSLAAETTATTRTYCALPDAIYNNGVSSIAWGASGWNYGNAANWKDFVVTCGGSHQSPINIATTSAVADAATPVINYIQKTTTTKYEENTNVVYTREYEGEFDYITALDSDGTSFRYYAKQFHMHTPSEHQIDGVYADLELHFVHQAIQDSDQDCNKIKNKLAVFGLLFKVSATAEDYEAFNPWFDTTINEVDQFDLSTFFSKMTDKTFYHYYGSLTTMPCSQTVNWYVFPEMLPLTQTQLDKFKALFSDQSLFPGSSNNRPIQNLNGRSIYKGTGSIYGQANLQLNLVKYGQLIIVTMISLLILF